VADKKNKSSK